MKNFYYYYVYEARDTRGNVIKSFITNNNYGQIYFCEEDGYIYIKVIIHCLDIKRKGNNKEQ